ncbi:MAG: pyridoxal phosphate-dependent decarboxylase family protein [bacterium]
MDKEAFKKYGRELVDWIAEYFDNIEDYPVKSRVEPGVVKKQLPASFPGQGEVTDTIIEDFKRIIMPGISHWQHPGWFAYFPANNSPVSVLAEMLTAGLGVQGMIWDTSPAATELEEVVMNWLRDMVGLPAGFSGVIQDTASTATLCALLSAREKVTAFEVNQKGFDKTLRVYTSSQTHSSIEKGVKIAGFGRQNLVYVDVDENFALKPGMLQKAIEEDLQKGFVPCCVVATLGTTSSMAMDPVGEIAGICRQYGIWLHVDAAFAGTAAIAPEFRGFMQGTHKADSFVFNPHKWMLTNFDCSAYFVKEPEILKRTFSIMPEYLKTAADEKVNNYRDWGIPLGRRFRSLKLWFVIRYYGQEGIAAMVRKHVDLAQKFASWLRDMPGYEILAPVNLSLVCFRYRKPGLDEASLNDFNKKLLAEINASGEVYLTHTVLNGKYCLRLSVGQRTTEERHVRRVFELLEDFVS